MANIPPRNFLSSSGPTAQVFNQVWDPTGVAYANIDSGGISVPTPIQTGVWRALQASDFAGGGGGGGSVVVTNTVTINSGTYGVGFTVITGSQYTIPEAVRSWSAAIVSGSCFINGSGSFDAPLAIEGGGYDGRWISASPIVIGATGSAANPSKVVVMWEA